jgi:hypothetical protein
VSIGGGVFNLLISSYEYELRRSVLGFSVLRIVVLGEPRHGKIVSLLILASAMLMHRPIKTKK